MDEELIKQLIAQIKGLTIVIEELPDNMADKLEEMLRGLNQEEKEEDI